MVAPSRLLGARAHGQSLDDDALIRRYRTSTLSFANFPGNIWKIKDMKI